jgi:hypothetical protein
MALYVATDAGHLGNRFEDISERGPRLKTGAAVTDFLFERIRHAVASLSTPARPPKEPMTGT